MKVYLAGPGVFRKDAAAHADRLKALCASMAIEALWPLDNAIRQATSIETARAIRQTNFALIERADAVVADVSPFRGPNMDPGTAFEIGYATALGKPVHLYSSTLKHTLLDRTATLFALHSHGGRIYDPDDLEVEHFGLTENLMIAAGVEHVHDDVAGALAAAVRR